MATSLDGEWSLTLADVEDAVLAAFERGRQSVLSVLTAAAELNGSLPAVMKHLDPDREYVISKAWSESQHPRDRNGRFIDANTINALAHSAQGIAELHANVKPGDEAKLDAAISAAQGEKQHGHPNVRIPSPTSAAPMTPRAEKMAGTVEFAQSLAAAVKAGNMPGDLPGMAEDLATAFSQMDPTDFTSLKGHLGLSPSMGPEQVAGKMLNTAAPTGVPPAKGDRDNPDLDAAMGSKPWSASTPKEKENPDPFGMKTAAEREKTEGSSFWNKPSPAASTPAEPPAPEPESDRPVFGPWSADDLIEAAKPLRREMDESAHDPEAFVRAAHEYGTWLKQFSPDELDGLAKSLGHDRPTGNTAKLATKVLLSLSGHEVPAAGHTGVVHDGDGGQTTYHEGAEVGKLAPGEESPAPKSEQAPDTKAAALDKAIPAESAVLSPGAVDEIAGHFEKTNAAMRDETAVRERLAARLTEPGQLEELAAKVFGKNIAEHLPKVDQRNHLLDALAKHARLRAESEHGKVKPPNSSARQQAERLALAHDSMSKLLNDKEGPFKSDYIARGHWSDFRAKHSREMEAHLKKHPELRAEFGKYTSIHDANPPPVPASTPVASSPEASHAPDQVSIGGREVGEHRGGDTGGQVERAGGGDRVQHPTGGEGVKGEGGKEVGHAATLSALTEHTTDHAAAADAIASALRGEHGPETKEAVGKAVENPAAYGGTLRGKYKAVGEAVRGIGKTEEPDPAASEPAPTSAPSAVPLTTTSLYNRAQRREERDIPPYQPSAKKWGMDPRPLSPHILGSLPTQEALRGIDKPMEVSGYTFPWKAEIRKLGGQYDRKRRVWYIPRERMNELPDAAKVMLRPAYVGQSDVAKSLAAWYGIGVPHGEMIA